MYGVGIPVEKGRALLTSLSLSLFLCCHPTKALVELMAIAIPDIKVPAVFGPKQEALSFCQTFLELPQTKRPGGVAYTLHSSLLYQLNYSRLLPPTPSGQQRLRLALASDRPLLLGWWIQFLEFVWGREHAQNQKRIEQLDHTIREERLHLWIVDDIPVSMAGHSSVAWFPSKNNSEERALGPASFSPMARLMMVFTPAELRGRGYATRAVTQLCHYLKDEKKAEHILLLADTSNPVSNSVYQKIGFEQMIPWDNYFFQ